MSSILVRAIQILESVGLTDVFIPFVLIFTISFVVLLRSKILATSAGDVESGRKPSLVIALVMALGTIIPHVLGWYPADFDIVMIINMSLPQVALWIVGIVMVLLFIGTATLGDTDILGKISGIKGFPFIALGIVAYIFFSSTGMFQIPNFLADPDIQALLLIAGAFGGIIWLIGFGGSGSSSNHNSGDGDSE